MGVLGGSGGTGHMGIQLAKAMGAKEVITTCSSSDIDFVKGLGADSVIDYHKQNYWEALPQKSVDVVYDCVGLSGTGDHAFPLLKDHGSFVSLLPTSMPSISTKLKRGDVHVNFPTCVGSCSKYDRIDKISALVGLGKLKVHIDPTYGLQDIAKAYNVSLGGPRQVRWHCRSRMAKPPRLCKECLWFDLTHLLHSLQRSSSDEPRSLTPRNFLTEATTCTNVC